MNLNQRNVIVLQGKEDNYKIPYDLINNCNYIFINNDKTVLFELDNTNITKQQIYIKVTGKESVYVLNYGILLGPGSVINVNFIDNNWVVVINTSLNVYRWLTPRAGGVSGVLANLFRSICTHTFYIPITNVNDKLKNGPGFSRLKAIVQKYCKKIFISPDNNNKRNKSAGNFLDAALSDKLSFKKFIELLSMFDIKRVSIVVTIEDKKGLHSSHGETIELGNNTFDNNESLDDD